MLQEHDLRAFAAACAKHGFDPTTFDVREVADPAAAKRLVQVTRGLLAMLYEPSSTIPWPEQFGRHLHIGFFGPP